jgi:hypothetical protein
VTQDHPIQRFASLGIAILGALVALSALPGLWVGIWGREAWGTGPIPLFAGFEGLTLLSGLTAVLVGLKPRKQGFGLAVLCIAGAVFVAAILGSMMLKNASSSVPSLKNFVLIRLAMSAGLGALCGLVMIGSRGDCWKRVIIGVALLSPALTILGLIARQKGALVSEMFSGVGPIASMVLWTAFSVLLGVITIAGGHVLIRAFELTREPKSEQAKSE